MLNLLIENQTHLEPVPPSKVRAPGSAGCSGATPHPPRSSHAVRAGLPQSRGYQPPQVAVRSHTDGETATFISIFLRYGPSLGQKSCGWAGGRGRMAA